ncbi:uncharacterized protein LOC108002670 isoform X1 [Apis cerana]|uniref:uncharacterized protein LOC108002670 isoform X1 n=1 Tax=Apis cerana TaxID=7461 RepID=UPI0007E2BCD2|nr:uncharacterized protein LOC108002670 isoform X1 [Apis cerana]XP_061939259.1 uncharacterized protein LOC108002670 isoform X1 [Apis cerana]
MDPRLFWIVCFCLIAILVSKDRWLIYFGFDALGWAIDCFKCVSIDGDNKPCDDPFHNNGSLAFLESPCLGGRKGRDGLFPATACIKIAGIYDESGISLTVRSCALDSGTLTTDSEIIRMSHCGGFYFDDKYVRGCVQSCNDADACNGSTRQAISLILLTLSIFLELICIT